MNTHTHPYKILTNQTQLPITKIMYHYLTGFHSRDVAYRYIQEKTPHDYFDRNNKEFWQKNHHSFVHNKIPDKIRKRRITL